MLDNHAYASSDETISGSETYRSVPDLIKRQRMALSDMPGIDTISIEFRVGSKVIRVPEAPVALWESIKAIVDRFAELSQLPPNWDSYGAPALSEESLEKAAEIACDVLIRYNKMPFVAPLSCGGVSLDWETEPHEIELEICGSTASLLFPVDDDERETEDIPVTRAKMLLLDWLRP